MLRKILIGVGILLLLLVAAAVIVPMVVDVDSYRPRITSAVNERINGKLELGHMKLSLWGQLRIELAGATLTDPKGRKVVSVSDAYFHVPFSSILSGSPILTLKMQHPEILVVKNKEGKLNVTSLMKESTAEASAQPGGSRDIVLPGIAARTRVGIEVRDALLTYLDEATGLDSKTRNLNLVIKDLSLSRPTDLELWADLDTKMGKSLTVRGPARLKATAQPTISRGRLSQVEASVNLDLNDLEILMPGLFEKRKGVEASARGSFKSSPQTATIENFHVKFFNADIAASGTIEHVDATPSLNVSLKSNPIDLKPWNELITAMKEYDLAGTATFDAQASGPSDALTYKADLAVKDLTAKAPSLKGQPVFNAVVNVSTDQIEKFLLTMKAPGNDLSIQGKMLSFAHPQLTASVSSTGMDLDQLIVMADKKAAAGAPAPAPGTSGGPEAGAAHGAKASDYDALLDPLRESVIARAMTAVIDANLKFLQFYGVRMSDVRAHLTMKDLVAALDQAGLGVFGGAVKLTATSDLKPKAPTYRFSGDVQKLSLKDAVASQFQLFKNTLIGTAFLKIDGSGSSFNPEAAKLNLNAKGNLRVENASFASIDVSKMAADAVNKALERVGDKLPALKGKKVNTTLNKESRYSSITSDFTITGGKFSSPNFVAKAEPNQGIDLNGSTTLGMVDYSLDAKWLVIDTYNVLKARDLSIEQNGVRVEHVLAEGNGPVRFPVNVGCKAVAPCYNYTDVPEFLAKVAVNNAGKALEGRAKAEVKKQIEDKAKQVLPGGLQGLGKKLFGH